MVGLSAVLQLSASFSPASSVGWLHADKTCDDITCSSDKGLRMAASADAMTSKTGRGFAVVTGANRGIGRIVANALADQGFRVVAVSRRAADAEEAVSGLPQKDADQVHVPLGIDLASLTNDANARRTAQAIRNIAAGKLELLVNNAGIYLDRWDQEAWDASTTVNYAAPIALARHLMPAIVDGGAVVSVSSGYGMLNELSPSYRTQISGADSLDALSSIAFDPADSMRSAHVAPYKVSKAMLNRATQLLARDNELSGRRVAVSVVCPGWCRTRMGGAGATRSAEQGGASVLWATQTRPNGKFTRDGRTLEW